VVTDVEGRMRRVIGLTASGLGTFFVVVALLMHFYVVGVAVKFPLNEYLVSTLVGHNVSYFSVAKLNELSGVTMQVTATVEGDVAAGTSTRAVWTEFSYAYDQTNGLIYQYSIQRLAFDRRTGVLIGNCCGDSIGTDTALHLSGQGYVWPFNTQKRTYQVFDTTLLKPEPATYQGTATIDGITTYKFVEQVPPTQYTTQTLPGSLVGESQPSVTLGQYYQATNTSWVDPVTGAPVETEKNQQVTLRDSTGAVRLNLFSGDLKMTPASIAASAKMVKSDDTKANLVITTVPLIAGLLGIVLLAFGLVLVLRRRPEYEEEGPLDDDEEDMSSDDEATQAAD